MENSIRSLRHFNKSHFALSCFFIRLHTYNIITSCFIHIIMTAIITIFLYLSFEIIIYYYSFFSSNILESNFYCRIVVFFCLFNPYLILLQMGLPLGQSITFISMDFFCFHHYCHKISLSIFPLLYILVVLFFPFVLLFLYINFLSIRDIHIYIYLYLYIYFLLSLYIFIYLSFYYNNK